MSFFSDIAGVATDPYGSLKKVFDPGASERERAQKMDREALQAWRNAYGMIPGVPQFDTYPEQYDPNWTPDPSKMYLDPYVTGPDLQAAQEQFLTDPQARALGLATESEATGKTSAYDNLGPSAYQDLTSAYNDLTSAYENAGPSAYTDLGFDPNSLEGMRGAQEYFANLSQTGYDPISEANYARRKAEAEQARRAQTEAALADAEMRGVGGVGNVLQAELSGNQAMAGDLYQAGLDQAAQAAERRDTASMNRADIAERAGRAQLDADALRAAGLDEYTIAQLTGLDTFSTNKAAGLDTFGTNRAAGMDTYNTDVAGGKDAFAADRWAAIDDWNSGERSDFYDVQQRNVDRTQSTNEQNWNRGNTVRDANTGLRNDLDWWNYVEGPQQQFGNYIDVTGGLTGQYSGAANRATATAGPRLNFGKDILMAGANASKAAAGGPGGVGTA